MCDCERVQAHHLPPDVLKKREVVHIDIAHDHVKSSDYKPESDPTKFKSQKTGRGPLTSRTWMSEAKPVMTCYKLVTAKFKWRFLPFSVEKIIHNVRQRHATPFHSLSSLASSLTLTLTLTLILILLSFQIFYLYLYFVPMYDTHTCR